MRTPPAELRDFLTPYGAEVSRLFFATRKAVLTAAPAANELIYDAYNAVAASYSFTNRLKEAFCHVAAYPKYVNLGFNRGAMLTDPERLLVGTGAKIRHIRIATVNDLKRHGIQELLRAAVEEGRNLTPKRTTKPHSVVKAIYANRRRPSAK
jgi:hypothetical protein